MLVNLIRRYLNKDQVKYLCSIEGKSYDKYSKIYPIEVQLMTSLLDGRSYTTKAVIIWHPLDQKLGDNKEFYALGDKFYRETLSVLFDTTGMPWFYDESSEFFNRVYNIFQFHKNDEVVIYDQNS